MSDRSKIVGEAADWLASQLHTPHPVIPVLHRRFDLTPKEAIEALRLVVQRKAGLNE